MRTHALALAFLWLAVPAAAASADDWRVCESDNEEIALAGCTRIIAAEPDAAATSEAYYNRGLIESHRHDVTAALADYSRAIALEPKNDFALHNRAMIYDRRGDYDKALADFTASIALNPIGGHFYNRGRANFHAGRFRDAADDFTTAMQLWPYEPSIQAKVLAYRCRALAAQGNDIVDARADCDKAVMVDPGNRDVLIARALVRFRQADYAGVIADTSKALAMAPLPAGGPLLDTGPADAYFLQGLAELRLGKNAAAERDLATAATDPKIAARYGDAGVAR